MDILFELVLNFGFWIIILVGALIYSSINRKDKKKQKKESKQNRKTVGQMGTNEQPPARDSTTNQKRNTRKPSRKDYLERLREQYQQEGSDSSSSQNTDEQIGRDQSEKNTQYREKRKKRPKRRRAAIEDYYDIESSEFENARSFAYRSTDKKEMVDLPAMNQKNLRQAIIMKEILDKPKSMRK